LQTLKCVKTFKKALDLVTSIKGASLTHEKKVLMPNGKTVFTGRVLDYIEAAKFGCEMYLEQGLVKEAQTLFEEDLTQFKEASPSLRVLDIKIKLS